MNYKPNVYVSAAIRCPDSAEARFLVCDHIHRGNDIWRFPGGKPEPGETLLGACARELKEELGITAMGLFFLQSYTHKADGALWTGVVFQCGDYKGTPTIMEPTKHGRIWWATPEELQEKNCYVEQRVAYMLREHSPF